MPVIIFGIPTIVLGTITSAAVSIIAAKVIGCGVERFASSLARSELGGAGSASLLAHPAIGGASRRRREALFS
jgi:hypothetical protein